MNLRKPFLGALLAVFTGVSIAAVDANKADPTELQGVKGLGPAMSTKIVDARKTGPFKDWDDLQARVKGIGPASSARLSHEGLTVNGAPFGASAAAEPVKPSAAAKAPKSKPAVAAAPK